MKIRHLLIIAAIGAFWGCAPDVNNARLPLSSGNSSSLTSLGTGSSNNVGASTRPKIPTNEKLKLLMRDYRCSNLPMGIIPGQHEMLEAGSGYLGCAPENPVGTITFSIVKNATTAGNQFSAQEVQIVQSIMDHVNQSAYKGEPYLKLDVVQLDVQGMKTVDFSGGKMPLSDGLYNSERLTQSDVDFYLPLPKNITFQKDGDSCRVSDATLASFSMIISDTQNLVPEACRIHGNEEDGSLIPIEYSDESISAYAACYNSLLNGVGGVGDRGIMYGDSRFTIYKVTQPLQWMLQVGTGDLVNKLTNEFSSPRSGSLASSMQKNEANLLFWTADKMRKMAQGQDFSADMCGKNDSYLLTQSAGNYSGRLKDWADTAVLSVSQRADGTPGITLHNKVVGNNSTQGLLHGDLNASKLRRSIDVFMNFMPVDNGKTFYQNNIDFRSVMLHEGEHAWAGLEHDTSSNSTSVMYPSIVAGEIRNSLRARDIFRTLCVNNGKRSEDQTLNGISVMKILDGNLGCGQ